MEKEGNSHKEAAMVIVKDRFVETESPDKEQPNKRARRKSSKGRIMDEGNLYGSLLFIIS